MERGASGVYAVASASIKVTNNRILNVQGPMPRGQLVQFNKVTGGGNQVNCNQGENDLGSSHAEDAINIYQSSGVESSYLTVYGNKILGGGPSVSGGGILIGDGGNSSFINARHNIVVNPGQYGMAVPGGQTINMFENLIYGAAQPFTNVGLYVWNQYNFPCSNISIFNNTVQFYNKDGKASPGWDGENCGLIGGWTGNGWNSGILAPSIINNVVSDTDAACAYW